MRDEKANDTASAAGEEGAAGFGEGGESSIDVV